MKKRICLLLLAGIMGMGIAGCSGEESPRYALIVNNTTAENQECSDSVWDGLVTYAETKEAVCQKYAVEGTERKDYAASIEAAVDDGAKVVVCIGEESEVPVYEAQMDYRNVKFILLNGEPHKRYANKTNIEENTIALHFNETQQGYVLGYTAVMCGYRNIGCMGGAETEKSLKIAAGFVQGVEAAGKELGLIDGDIQLFYTFTGVDKLSPVYMSRAMDWYSNGCEVIFALDEGVRLSVIEATKLQSGAILGADKNCLAESDQIVAAAVIDYAGAVTNQIELFETDAFVGEQILNCGVKEDGVAMVANIENLSDNTVAQYNAMCQKLSEGTLTVEETMVVPATTITTVVKE